MGSLTPVDDNGIEIGGGRLTPVSDTQAPQHDESWLNQIVTPAQLQQWKKKGHIGAIEAFNRFDKWDMLPYVGGMQDGYDIPIAMKIRAAANGDELSTKDKQDVVNFIRDYSEIQARGYSFGGNMVNGGLAGIPFLVEAGVALGTGGLAAGGTASKMVAKGGAKAIVGAAVKSVIGRTLGKEIVEQSAEMTGKAIAKNAALRAASTLPSVLRNYGSRRINDGIAVTDKGEIYAKESQESPAVSALKALGNTEIELASEMSGGLLFHPLTHGAGAIAKSIMPRKLVSALDELALTKGGKAVSTMLRARDKVGFNGFLEDMGEEAVGDVLKTTFDLDSKEGYSFDQFLDAATFNRGSDLMVTAGLVAIQGGVSIGTVKAVNALAKSGMPQEKIDEVMAHTSELEKENIAERFNDGDATPVNESEIVAEAPPGVEQTSDFTAAHSFPEAQTLYGSVEQNVAQDNVVQPEETASQRMDNALATESQVQQQKMDDTAKAGETVNLNAVDRARKNQIRSDIKVIDKQMSILSKQYDDTAKRMAETTDDKQADKIQKELDKIETQMNTLSNERSAKELDSELVGKTITTPKNELVQMTRDTATELQRIDKSKRVLRAIKTGFDSGVAMTRASLKIAQKEYSNLVKLLPKAQREKVAFDFKKFNSVEEAKKNLPEFESKIENILKAVNISDKHAAIEKALQQKATIKTGSTKKAAFDVENTAVYKELQNILNLRKDALKSTEHEKLSDANKQKRADAQNYLHNALASARFGELPQDMSTRLSSAGVEVKPGSFYSRIINRAISYANVRPENASINEMTQLIDDINRLKTEGRAARDAADLEKRLNKSAIVDDVIDAIDKTKKLSRVEEAIKKLYAANMASMRSLFNAYMGKTFAEKYDPSLAQVKLSNAIWHSMRDIHTNAYKSLGLKRVEDLTKPLVEMGEVNKEWVLNRIDSPNKVNRYLSLFDIMDIYNSVKNENIRDDYYRYYGEAQVNNLLSRLDTPELVKLADSLFTHLGQYENVFNEYSLRKKGLPIEKRNNYWPATSEHEPQDYDALNTYIAKSNLPTAMKTKYANTVPVPNNAWRKMQKHVHQAEYVTHLADTYEMLDTMLKDKDSSLKIKQDLGDKVYSHMTNEVEYLSLTKRRELNVQFGETVEWALGNWTAVSVARPSVWLNQMNGTYVYSAEEGMDVLEWTKGYMHALAHPKETIDYMRKELPYLESRFHEGYDEAIAGAIRNAEKASTLEQDWTKALSYMTKTSDIGSVMFGGYPYYKMLIDSGMSKEEANDKFMDVTERISQGKESSNLSQMQKNRGVFSVFSRFLNSPNQFLRQIVDAHIQYRRGEISSATYAKKMAQYAVIQPVLYATAKHGYKAAIAGMILASGAGDPDERDLSTQEWLSDCLDQIMLTPFNAISFINDISDIALKTVENKFFDGKKRIYNPFEPQMLTDLGANMMGVSSSVQHDNAAGVVYNFAMMLQPFAKIPTKQIFDVADFMSGGELKDSVSNKKKKSMYSNTW
jgi:hypothetical protein